MTANHKWLLLTLVLGTVLMLSAPLGALAQGAGEGCCWWNDRVFYEIFVRSFKDSDGDGIGDLQGLIQQLDYLNDDDDRTKPDLAITGLWLMPVTEAASYHGYDTLDYRQIEQDYGSLDDFRQLIDAAHQRGIAVLIDLVINHSSDQHPWFVASAQGNPEYDDWYVWADQDPGYRGPDGQVVWHERGGRYYYGVFWGGMPDLNYANPAVSEEMIDVARFWLDEVGADGFRIDAVKHLIEDGREQENTPATLDWIETYQDALHEFAPDSLLVGEVWSTSYASADYVGNGIDLVFEFDLATGMLHAARQRNADGVRSLQNRALDLYPPGQYATFLTNHDQTRVMTELRENVDAARVAASALLTGPGVPFIYYGEEIGMTGTKRPGDYLIRTPMQWDATPATAGFTTGEPWHLVNVDLAEVNVALQQDDPDSLLSHYRTLIQLRNEHAALQRGAYIPIDTGSRRVYAFLRQNADETLLVLINFDDDPVVDYGLTLEAGSVSADTAITTLFGTDSPLAAPAIDANGQFSAYQPLPELAPYSTLILQVGS